MVTSDYFRTNIKSDAQTLKTLGYSFGPVKFPEYIGLIFFWNTYSIIFYSQYQEIIFYRRINFQFLYIRGIFNRIGYIIENNLFQAHFISQNQHIAVATDANPVIRVSLPNHFD